MEAELTALRDANLRLVERNRELVAQWEGSEIYETREQASYYMREGDRLRREVEQQRAECLGWQHKSNTLEAALKEIVRQFEMRAFKDAVLLSADMHVLACRALDDGRGK